ncbi:MAG: hypothetical protein ACE5Q6_05250 [Dehalococcoidia bacterium]
MTRFRHRKPKWARLALLAIAVFLASFGSATPVGTVLTIPAGNDHYEVHQESGGENSFVWFHNFFFSDLRAVPGDLFGPGCNDFLGVVPLVGDHLDPDNLGTNDLQVQRLEDAIFPTESGLATVDVEIVALSLKSVDPITVTGCDGGPQQWDLHLVLDPNPTADGNTGRMSIRQDAPDEGTADINLKICPKIHFTSLAGGQMVSAASCQEGEPPLTAQGFGLTWTMGCPPGLVGSTGSDFCIEVPNTKPIQGPQLQMQASGAQGEPLDGPPETGTIEIQKESFAGVKPGFFPFFSPQLGEFTLNPDEEEFEDHTRRESLPPGVYQVTEGDTPGWRLVDNFCVNDFLGTKSEFPPDNIFEMVTINLAAGSTVTCVFINFPDLLPIDFSNINFEELTVTFVTLGIPKDFFPVQASVPFLAAPPAEQTLTLLVDGLPEFGQFTDNGDGTGELGFEPQCGDAGIYPMAVNLTNSSEETVSEEFTVTVTPSRLCNPVGGPASFQAGNDSWSVGKWSIFAGGATAAIVGLLVIIWYGRKWRLRQGP